MAKGPFDFTSPYVGPKGKPSPVWLEPDCLPAEFWAKVNVAIGGCWLWRGAHGEHGYGSIKFREQTRTVHRLMYEFAYGPIENGLHVLHSCDTPNCINPAHLSLGTHMDNMRDMLEKGRRGAVGRRAGSGGRPTSINRDAVIKIRELYAGGLGYRKISRVVNVSRSHIQNICRGRAWTHIQLEKAA